MSGLGIRPRISFLPKDPGPEALSYSRPVTSYGEVCCSLPSKIVCSVHRSSKTGSTGFTSALSVMNHSFCTFRGITTCLDIRSSLSIIALSIGTSTLLKRRLAERSESNEGFSWNGKLMISIRYSAILNSSSGGRRSMV